MNHSYPSSEAPSERLLLIYMEAKSEWASDHRHIVAQIVRRAMRDTILPNGGRPVYHDGKDATGYRWATWSGPLARDRYCDGMRLRGQIDVRGEKLADGQPYGNRVSFKCDVIEHREAKAMAEMFRLLEKQEAKFRDKGFRFDDKFADQCRLLMMSLNITKIVVSNQSSGTPNLGDKDLFTEYTMADLGACIDHRVNELHA